MGTKFGDCQQRLIGRSWGSFKRSKTNTGSFKMNSIIQREPVQGLPKAGSCSCQSVLVSGRAAEFCSSRRRAKESLAHPYVQAMAIVKTSTDKGMDSLLHIRSF